MYSNTVCYCANITESDICNAVIHGCKTIQDVRIYLSKLECGMCKDKNPTQKCCHRNFEKIILKYL